MFFLCGSFLHSPPQQGLPQPLFKWVILALFLALPTLPALLSFRDLSFPPLPDIAALPYDSVISLPKSQGPCLAHCSVPPKWLHVIAALCWLNEEIPGSSGILLTLFRASLGSGEAMSHLGAGTHQERYHPGMLSFGL